MNIDKKISQILREELTKSDVTTMIDNSYSSKDFEKAVRAITAEAIADLFKTMWQKNSLWKSNLK